MKTEIEERIFEMRQPDYHFPKRFKKLDYISVTVVVVGCLAMVIGGYYL